MFRVAMKRKNVPCGHEEEECFMLENNTVVQEAVKWKNVHMVI
jgi:hypothetical protein